MHLRSAAQQVEPNALTFGPVSVVVTTTSTSGAIFVAMCAALLAVSCTSAVPGPSPAPSPSVMAATPSATSQSGASAALGAMFDPPPSPPGYQWTRNGAAVSFSELSTQAGSACDAQSVTFLRIGWPLGTVATNRLESWQYIRDPQGVFTRKPFRQRLDLHATLPNDARPTGYRYSTAEIHLSPSDQDEYIYVVGPVGAERWPRSEPMTLCF
jgi:hypothetical protein